MVKEFEIKYISNRGHEQRHQETESLGMAIIHTVNYIDFYRRRKIGGVIGLKITIEEIRGE